MFRQYAMTKSNREKTPGVSPGFFIILIFFFSSPNAWANDQFIYLGGDILYSVTRFNLKNISLNENLSNNSVSATQGGALIGYGVLIDSIYLGVEGGLQFGRLHVQDKELNDNLDMPVESKVTLDEIYYVDFRPGYVIFNRYNLIYGILGFKSANFRVTGEESDVDLDSGPMRKNGLRFGIGYNLRLSRHFMGRVEYVFTKFFENQFDENFSDNQTETWQLNPYSNEINVGLAVVFNV